MTANTAQRVAVETDERLVFVDACGDMLRKLGKPIMGRELKATAETLALEVERLLELASQITTDWIPANRKLAERAEAAESKLAEQAAEIERLSESLRTFICDCQQWSYDSLDTDEGKRIVIEWMTRYHDNKRRAEAAERAMEEAFTMLAWFAHNPYAYRIMADKCSEAAAFLAANGAPLARG